MRRHCRLFPLWIMIVLLSGALFANCPVGTATSGLGFSLDFYSYYYQTLAYQSLGGAWMDAFVSPPNCDFLQADWAGIIP
jgi:hypothetical protein